MEEKFTRPCSEVLPGCDEGQLFGDERGYDAPSVRRRDHDDSFGVKRPILWDVPAQHGQ